MFTLENTKERMLVMLEAAHYAREDWTDSSDLYDMNGLFNELEMLISIEEYSDTYIAVTYYSAKIHHIIIIDSDIYCSFDNYEHMTNWFMDFENQARELEDALI